MKISERVKQKVTPYHYGVIEEEDEILSWKWCIIRMNYGHCLPFGFFFLLNTPYPVADAAGNESKDDGHKKRY